MRYSICVPTVRPTTVLHTVHSIIAQTWPDWELLLVGQGDDPDLARVGTRAEKLDSRIRYIHLEQRAISPARNAGLRAASGDIVAMLDDDCEAAPDWLQTLTSLFTKYPHVGVIGGALIAPPVSHWKLESCLSFVPAEVLYDPASGKRPTSEKWWVGANFALRKAVADAVGLFDECLGAGSPQFPAAEDTDYGMRVMAAGVATLTSPAPVVFHTYGTRRGIRQNFRTARSYACGNAGLDGKLTLAGNPHGQWSASRVLRQGLTEAVASRKLHRLPIVLLYGLDYHIAYRRCLREYVLDDSNNLRHAGALQPRMAAPLRRKSWSA